MPVIRVDMFEGRPKETKQELVTAFTREIVRITGCSEASVNVIINDVSKENWGLGGELAINKFPD